jgi:hypothetical protein
MKRAILPISLGVISLLTITLCSSQSVSDIAEIRYGSQFGMCEGYCYSEMIYTETLEKSISMAWADTILNPTIIDTVEIKKKKWTNLTNAVALDNFYSLEPKIGCPDCDDGGESWIEINTGEKSYRVSYEYGNTPKPLEELVRQIKN